MNKGFTHILIIGIVAIVAILLVFTQLTKKVDNKTGVRKVALQPYSENSDRFPPFEEWLSYTDEASKLEIHYPILKDHSAEDYSTEQNANGFTIKKSGDPFIDVQIVKNSSIEDEIEKLKLASKNSTVSPVSDARMWQVTSKTFSITNNNEATHYYLFQKGLSVVIVHLFLEDTRQANSIAGTTKLIYPEESNWEEAVSFLENCEFHQINEFTDKSVGLAEGNLYTGTEEPTYGAIKDIVNRLKQKCGEFYFTSGLKHSN